LANGKKKERNMERGEEKEAKGKKRERRDKGRQMIYRSRRCRVAV